VGFEVNGADLDPERDALIVRDRDSFAWPEVYFAGHGWVAFNPTPDRPALIRPTRVSSGPGSGRTIDPNILENLPASGDPIINLPEEGGFGLTGPAPASGGGGTTSYWPIALAAAAAFVAMLAGAASLGWQRSAAGLPADQQVWDKAVRLASWGGLPPAPGETPHEYARTIGRRFGLVKDAEALADAYTRSRFGRTAEARADKSHAEQAWRRLRGPLAGSVIGRPLRRKRRLER
jgi:hypothetical protein